MKFASYLLMKYGLDEQGGGWSIAQSSWRPITRDALWGQYWLWSSSMLSFVIWVMGQSVSSKFPDDTKLRGVVYMPENCATIRWYLNKNLVRFNKGKCKVLHLWRMYQYTLVATDLKSSFAEKDLGVLVLNTSQQSALAGKKRMVAS